MPEEECCFVVESCLVLFELLVKGFERSSNYLRAAVKNMTFVEPVETGKKRKLVETGTPFDKLRDRLFQFK